MPESEQSADLAPSLAQARAWLESTLMALQCGAEPELTHAMLLKAREYLDQAAHTTVPNSFKRATDKIPFSFGVKLDRGQRHHDHPNEDNFFAASGMLPWAISIPFGLFVIADGMGGHEDGQVASHLAIEHFVDAALAGLFAGRDPGDTLLIDAVQAAHQAIVQTNRAGSNMGSVFTCALIIDATAYIANIGDSRVYLYRPDEGLRQITRDHSMVASLVEAGKIKAEEIYTHPLRNQVYRTLGDMSTQSVQVDLFALKLWDGDKVLLCSDGVWEMMRDHEIEKIMRSPVESSAETAFMLYEAAMRGGGNDNISAIVVEYGTPVSDMQTLLDTSESVHDEKTVPRFT